MRGLFEEANGGKWIRPEDIPFDQRRTSADFIAQSIADIPTMDQLKRRYIQLVLEKLAGCKETGTSPSAFELTEPSALSQSPSAEY